MTFITSLSMQIPKPNMSKYSNAFVMSGRSWSWKSFHSKTHRIHTSWSIPRPWTKPSRKIWTPWRLSHRVNLQLISKRTFWLGFTSLRQCTWIWRYGLTPRDTGSTWTSFTTVQYLQTSLEKPPNSSLTRDCNFRESCGQVTRIQKPFTIWWSSPESRSSKKWLPTSKSCKRKYTSSWRRSASSSADSSSWMTLSSSNSWHWRTQVKILVCTSTLCSLVLKICIYSQLIKWNFRRMKAQVVLMLVTEPTMMKYLKKIRYWVEMRTISMKRNQSWLPNRALRIAKWESKESMSTKCSGWSLRIRSSSCLKRLFRFRMTTEPSRRLKDMKSVALVQETWSNGSSRSRNLCRRQCKNKCNMLSNLSPPEPWMSGYWIIHNKLSWPLWT